LEEIGFFDAIAENIVLVEWPEIAAGFLPPDAIHIYLSVKETGRELQIGSPPRQ
jgi:tRNA A37 threonylcarbamoyladenosine biosynthesis protein TsaE